MLPNITSSLRPHKRGISGDRCRDFIVATTIRPAWKESVSDEQAAEQSPNEIAKFLEAIGLDIALSDVKVPEEELDDLAKQCMVLPDYKGNPRVATEEEMLELVRAVY